MQLFFNSEIDKGQSEIIFPKDESGHIAKVLRKAVGDTLFVTNGKGYRFKTKITDANSNKCKAEIIAVDFQKKPDYKLHMAVAPTKMNDRFEWFLEKATEIGVHEITPIFCEHSERKKVKLKRFERVLQSAMKQSLQFYMPKLNELISFSEFIEHNESDFKYIAHCEDTYKKALQNLILPETDSCVIIGPEGDFSPDEIKTALEKGWESVSLGNTRLRTETAAIVACHSFALKNEN